MSNIIGKMGLERFELLKRMRNSITKMILEWNAEGRVEKKHDQQRLRRYREVEHHARANFLGLNT
jgi:hypothetical protein